MTYPKSFEEYLEKLGKKTSDERNGLWLAYYHYHEIGVTQYTKRNKVLGEKEFAINAVRNNYNRWREGSLEEKDFASRIETLMGITEEWMIANDKQDKQDFEEWVYNRDGLQAHWDMLNHILSVYAHKYR